MKKLLISLLLILSSQVSMAKDYVQILKIINTENSEPANLYIANEGSKLVGLKLITTKRTNEYSFQEVLGGTTLLKKSGISIISVKAENISPYSGGEIKLTYLKNFSIQGSAYAEIKLKIKKINNQWKLLHDEIFVKSIYLTPHPFGISSYEFQ